jgi:hypothetical protein
MTICKLCKVQEATQRNSHITPKFMGISMIKSSDGLHKGYKFTSFKGSFRKPFQDTPKEDYIFCPDCESLINKKFETPISKQFYQTRNTCSTFFEVHYRRLYSYRVYYKIDYVLFTKFIYSIIFRAGISSVDYFSLLSLPLAFTEQIRRILLNEIPFKSFPLIITTCPNNPNPTGNFIGAFSSDKNVHLFGLNEYILFLDLSGNHHFEKMFPNLSNANYEQVRIIAFPYVNWNSLIMGPIFGPVLDSFHKRIGIKFLIDGLFLHKWITQGLPYSIIKNNNAT